MKVFVIIMALFTALTVQAATVSAKALGDIEARIELQKEDLEKKLRNFDTDDITEGKIVAAIVMFIEDSHDKVQASVDAINSDEELTEEAVQEMTKVLDEVDQMILAI